MRIVKYHNILCWLQHRSGLYLFLLLGKLSFFCAFHYPKCSVCFLTADAAADVTARPHIYYCRSPNMEDFTCWWHPLNNLTAGEEVTYVLTYCKECVQHFCINLTLLTLKRNNFLNPGNPEASDLQASRVSGSCERRRLNPFLMSAAALQREAFKTSICEKSWTLAHVGPDGCQASRVAAVIRTNWIEPLPPYGASAHRHIDCRRSPAAVCLWQQMEIWDYLL